MSQLGLMTDGEHSAVLSADRKYRYALSRIWDRDLPPALFIGLNPSTADEREDDATIRRCIRFARDWGYGGLLMGNLYARRATDPKVLLRWMDDLFNPVSGEGEWRGGVWISRNDEMLCQMDNRSAITIAAWGSSKQPQSGRVKHIERLLKPLHCLGTTVSGHPRHPLYVKADVCPRPFVASEDGASA